VIWEPMYPGDSRGRIDADVFADRRVTSFWDQDEISGKWLGSHKVGAIEGGIVWDAYYAFGPDTHWEARPGQVVATGAPIIGGVDTLQDRFVPLLGSSSEEPAAGLQPPFAGREPLRAPVPQPARRRAADAVAP
jgi:hypothetical protein